MHMQWSQIELFLAIAEHESLSAASRILGVTQPTVSRQLAELEEGLGEPLFVRSAAGVTLTTFGERLVPAARRMADDAAEIARLTEHRETTPSGVVRVTAPPGVAYQFVAPVAAKLRTSLPDVRIEIVSTVRYVDLVRRDADLALRAEPLDRPATQRDLVVLATSVEPVAAFATRELAASLPKGYTMADVPWIAWAPPLEHLPPNPQLAKMIPGFRPAFASDDFIVQLRAAEAGAGAVILSRFTSRVALPSPLVEMKLSFGKLTTAMHLVAARASLAIPRVKAVADAIARELEPPRRRGAAQKL